MQEYLDTLNEAAWGAASEAKPKFVSRSTPLMLGLGLPWEACPAAGHLSTARSRRAFAIDQCH